VTLVGVVGLGTMGAGIAQLAVEAGLQTVGRELDPERAAAARGRIEHFLARKVEKGRLSAADREAALARLRLTTDLAELAGCGVVIEAAYEDRDVKQELFRQLEAVVDDETVIATNTSALSVTEIAAVLARPERAVGMHFFNPAPLMPLVEVVRAERSGDEAVEAAVALAERLGKTAVRCADTPGFVVNRVLIPLLNDCVRVLDETGVTPADLDAALTNGAGWPLGPCALLDLVGLDVHVHAGEALYEKLREPRMAPPPRLVRMVRADKLGRKSGEGFYRY
jgi:3-hydroxybutyryl-CoA dehydrogenase